MDKQMTYREGTTSRLPMWTIGDPDPRCTCGPIVTDVPLGPCPLHTPRHHHCQCCCSRSQVIVTISNASQA
jgi:hypothetical protein